MDTGRLDALSIELLDSGKDKLAEEYGKVIENVQTRTLSMKLKNTDLSGTPNAGSMEAKRFANIVGNAYGTARTAGKGQKIKVEPVTVKINDKMEYLEEVESYDMALYGVDGMIERRTRNHGLSMEVELDTKFFKEASDNGTALDMTGITDIADEIEKAVQTLETVKNKFVNGVPRNMIEVVCSPSVYGKLRNKIATLPNANATVTNYEEGVFNNTKIYSTVNLPEGVEYLVMINGAVAQPMRTNIYNPKQIGLSDAIAFGMFTYKGTTAVTPDLIFKKLSV